MWELIWGFVELMESSIFDFLYSVLTAIVKLTHDHFSLNATMAHRIPKIHPTKLLPLQRLPIPHLRLTHEAANIVGLAQLKSLTPQQHIHCIQMKVRIRNNKAVVIIRQLLHPQRLAQILKRHVHALFRSLVERLLVHSVVHGDALREKFFHGV
jgi:hypothetical protein